MLSAVSLAMRGATWGSEVIYNLLDLKVRTAFDANDQVFLIYFKLVQFRPDPK